MLQRPFLCLRFTVLSLRRGFAPNPLLFVASSPAGAQLLAMGCAAAPAILIQTTVLRPVSQPDPGTVRPLTLADEQNLRWDISFIWRKCAYLFRAAQAWLELMRERGYGQPLVQAN